MNTTLSNTLWPSMRKSILGRICLALSGTILLAISAKVQVPFWPVPVTMQTFVVLILGITYGSRLGAFTGGLYLLEGAIGLPVFATGSGVMYLLGPTGGYLVGFAVAMYVVGLLAERKLDRSVFQIIVTMLVGEVIIFVFGVGWLARIIGLEQAISVGLKPFLLVELFSIALAAATVPILWKKITPKN